VNRIDRLHAILTHLQSKRRVTAQEIADRFNISLRTVYRDVKALDESGVPVIGEAGSGYSIMEGYRLPPVMFSQQEANALLLGGKLAEKLTDGSIRQHFEAALFKIKAVLRTTDKENLDHLTNHIEVLRFRGPDENADSHLTALQQSIAEKRVIFIHYHSGGKEELSERMVEPIGLWYYSMYWHLIGWCRLRKGYRDFRVSRIQRLQLKDERFDASVHPTLHGYIESMKKDKSELNEVVVTMQHEYIRYIRESRYYYGFVKDEPADGNCTRMYFMTGHMDYFARWLLTFTNAVKVESPQALKDTMTSLSQQLHQHYAG
jgi:predicted DNA-binding transcriptional regulator YafY